MPGHSYTINGHTFTADHLLTPDEARQIQTRFGGAIEPAATTTTTPVSGAGPLQAIGQTLTSFGRRTVEGSRELAEALREGQPRAALGATLRGVLPAVAPGMTAAGLGAETVSRMLPAGGEADAARARNVGEIASFALPFGPGVVRPIAGAVRSARGRLGLASGGEAPFAPIAEAAARKAVVKNLPRRVGRYTDASVFAEKAQPFLRVHLRDLEAAGPSAEATRLRELVGSPSLKPLARAVREDPAEVARYLERWPDLQPELRRAHMGELVRGATRQRGVERGVLNLDTFTKGWNALGDAEKVAIYGAKQTKAIDKLVANMATLVPSGEAAGKTVPLGRDVGRKILHALEGGGVAFGAYRMATGHLREGATEIGSALLARLLIKNGGPDWINAVVSASRDPRVWVQSLPALGKIGVQILGQPDEHPAARRAPPTAPMPFGPPMTRSSAAPAAGPNALLDSPEGILAAIENTVLPSGWRPGQAPVMR